LPIELIDFCTHPWLRLVSHHVVPAEQLRGRQHHGILSVLREALDSEDTATVEVSEAVECGFLGLGVFPEKRLPMLLVSCDLNLEESIGGGLLVRVLVSLRPVVDAKVGLGLVRGRDPCLVVNADVTAGLGVLQPDDLAGVYKSEFRLQVAHVLPVWKYLPHRQLSPHVDFEAVESRRC
jgi:hypothetical protein